MCSVQYSFVLYFHYFSDAKPMITLQNMPPNIFYGRETDYK